MFSERTLENGENRENSVEIHHELSIGEMIDGRKRTKYTGDR